MSTAVFPTLPGLMFPVQRSPVFDTRIQSAISGKETRIALQSYPRWKWEISMSILRSAAAYLEFQQLAGFFNSRLGQWDTFLYQDADDNSVLGQAIGSGTGTTADFQLVRSFGGFVEPVLAPNTVSAVYLNGVSTSPNVLTPPGACSLSSTAGGSLAATTYYVRAVWNTATGETLAGTESTVSVAANNVLVVNAPAGPPSGAIGWTPYVSNTAMGGSGAEQYQNTGALGLSTPWTEPTTGLVSGGALPTSNTTGWTWTPWGTASPGPGMLVFYGAPPNGAAITADFTYYWPCRFNMDSAEFSLFLQGFYELKKLSLISVKN